MSVYICEFRLDFERLHTCGVSSTKSAAIERCKEVISDLSPAYDDRYVSCEINIWNPENSEYITTIQVYRVPESSEIRVDE